MFNFGGYLFMKRKNTNLVLMYLIVFMQGFIFYGPYATLYRAERGVSISQMFIIDAIFMAFTIFLEIPWGYFADKFGYRRTLIISNGVMLVSKVVFLYSFSFGSFLLERFLIAVSICGISGSDRALIYNCIEENEATKVFGKYEAAGTIGFLLASLISTFIVKVSLTATAVYTIPPYIIAFILTFFLSEIERENKGKESGLLSTLKEAVHNKSLLLLAVFYAIFTNMSHTVVIFLSQLKYKEIGIDIAYFGMITAFVHLSRVLSARAHVFENKFNTKKGLIFLSIITTVFIALLSFIAFKSLTIISMAIVAASVAMMVPIYSSIQNKQIGNANRATMLSCYAIIESVLAIGFNIIISIVTRISINFSIAITAGLGVIGFLILLRFIKLDKEKA